MTPLFEKIKQAFRRPPIQVALLASAIIAMLIFFYGFEVPRVTYVTNEIQNAGHAPFFGVMTLISLMISRLFLSKKFKSPLQHYGAAIAASTSLGFILEITQIGTARSADPMDILRNIAGSVIALGLWYTVDRKTLEMFPPKRFLSVPRIRILCVISALLLLVPILTRLRSNAERDRAFPIICDFNEPWSMAFVKKSGCWISRGNPPEEWTQARGKSVFRMRTSMFDYPRIKIEEPYPDWTGYSALTFDLFSTMKEPFPIEIKIDDYKHDNHYHDRFNKKWIVQPGVNAFRIPLEEVRNAPYSRKMDMKDIRSLTILLDHPKTRYLFFINSFRLEK